MGIAVIIPNVNYQDANLGKVTLQQGVPLRSMTIVGPDEITEPTIFTVNFFPANTSQRSVVWSIVSGGTYASINADTGELTPIVGASLDDVVVRATSSADNSIYAEKAIVVSYGMVYEEKLALVGDGLARINTGYQPKSNTRFVFDYQIVALPTATGTAQYRSLWGAYNSANSPLCRHMLTIVTTASTVKQVVQWGANVSSQTTGFSANTLVNASVGVRMKEEVSMREGFIINHGQSDWTQVFLGGFTAPNDAFMLFAATTDSVTATEMKCFSAKFYENETLVKELIPCTLVADISGANASDGNAHYSGENGMWDKVGKKFYANSYSGGSFTVNDF